MLTVAGVGAIICDNWKGPKISKKRIVATLLVHDLANIMKYDLSKRGMHLLTPSDRKRIAFLRAVKEEAIARYGKDPEEAITKIAKGLNFSKSVTSLLERMSAVHSKKYELDELFARKDWELAICLYSDWRVSPKGIVSVNERVHDLSVRYGIGAKESRELLSELSGVERCLLRNVKLRPAEINDSSTRHYIRLFRSGESKTS